MKWLYRKWHFRTYFRMYTDTLNSIISYLALQEPFATLLGKGHVCRHKKLPWFVLTLEANKVTYELYNNNFLFNSLIVFRPLSQLFGTSEDTFLKCTDVVMDTLIADLQDIIGWAKTIWISRIFSLNLRKLDASSQRWQEQSMDYIYRNRIDWRA